MPEIKETNILRKRHAELVADIKKNDVSYYDEHAPTITDASYDRLFAMLKELERLHPELVTPDSPTQKVSGSVKEENSKVKHLTPMLSLYTETDFSSHGAADFIKRVSNYLGASSEKVTGVNYCCELKFDGLAVNLIYVNGTLFSGATRGDGEFGEDVTDNVRNIPTIPKEITGTLKKPGLIEVRGEVLMPKSVFKAINDDLIKSGKRPYSNERAAAAGALRLSDPSETLKRGLIFFAYGVGQVDGFKEIGTQSKWLSTLKSLGFAVHDSTRLENTEDGLVVFHKEAEAMRSSLDFGIDGVVYKVDSIGTQDKIGFSGREPKWATAHKFEPEDSSTFVEGIDVQVGRTGKLTPVARVFPVLVGGTVISNVTLHNESHIKKLGIRVGDFVSVRRAGDVIPEIGEVISRDLSTSVPYEFPTECPVCGSALHKEVDGVDYRCTGGSICGSQVENSMVHFASRKALNITGLGDKTVESLVRTGALISLPDIYTLTVDKLTATGDIGKLNAEKIIAAIESTKKTSLRKLLYALGIRHASEGTAKRLSEHYGSLNAIRAATVDELMAIDDIGPVVAESIYTFFNDEKNKAMVDDLLSHGVTCSDDTPKQLDGSLTGKTFVITGVLDGMTREEVKQIIESKGGTVSDSVNKNTSYVIAGNKAGSKLDKAVSLGVKFVSGYGFEKAVKDDRLIELFTESLDF